jgi:hypothetical protein
MKSNRKKLLLWVVVVACVNFVSPSYSDDNDKVTLCHKGHTIKVSRSALRAHLDHGDTIGSCEITPNRNR